MAIDFKLRSQFIDFCFYISPFPSTMSTARQPHAAALPLKDFFILSTPWTSVGVAYLSLTLAKGRGIQGALPNSKSYPNSTTPKSSNMFIHHYKPTKTQQPQTQQANTQKQTNHPHPKKQPTKNKLTQFQG